MPQKRGAMPLPASLHSPVRGAVSSHKVQTMPPRAIAPPHTGQRRGKINDAASASMSLNIDIDSRINMFPLLLPRRRGQRLAQKLSRARHGTAVLDLEQYAKDIRRGVPPDGADARDRRRAE